MSNIKMGQLVDKDAQKDAAHVAVAPVTAATDLTPGSAIGFVGDDPELVGLDAEELIGVVDPFIRGMVRKGDRFWMCLYPESVVVLRHDWTHPAFADRVNKSESLAWFDKWAQTLGYEYKTGADVVRAITKWLNGDNKDRWDSGELFGFNSPSDLEEDLSQFNIWKHYEILTGIKPDPYKKSNLISFCC